MRHVGAGIRRPTRFRAERRAPRRAPDRRTQSAQTLLPRAVPRRRDADPLSIARHSGARRPLPSTEAARRDECAQDLNVTARGRHNQRSRSIGSRVRRHPHQRSATHELRPGAQPRRRRSAASRPRRQPRRRAHRRRAGSARPPCCPRVRRDAERPAPPRRSGGHPPSRRVGPGRCPAMSARRREHQGGTALLVASVDRGALAHQGSGAVAVSPPGRHHQGRPYVALRNSGFAAEPVIFPRAAAGPGTRALEDLRALSMATEPGEFQRRPPLTIPAIHRAAGCEQRLEGSRTPTRRREHDGIAPESVAVPRVSLVGEQNSHRARAAPFERQVSAQCHRDGRSGRPGRRRPTTISQSPPARLEPPRGEAGGRGGRARSEARHSTAPTLPAQNRRSRARARACAFAHSRPSDCGTTREYASGRVHSRRPPRVSTTSSRPWDRSARPALPRASHPGCRRRAGCPFCAAFSNQRRASTSLRATPWPFR